MNNDPRIKEDEDKIQKIARTNGFRPKDGWIISVYDAVDSTMVTGRLLVPEVGTEKPGLVLARTQANGRGRQGRRWESGEGGYYATLVTEWDSPISELSGFSLAVGCLLSRALARCEVPVRLKWPNDVLSEDGRKLAGILIEVVTREGRTYVLTGIGLNLLNQLDAVDDAVSLRSLTEKAPAPVDFAASFLSLFWEGFRDFQHGGFGGFKAEWTRQAILVGKKVKIDTGSRIESGRCVGVSEDGSLRIDTGTMVRDVSAGHVLSYQ